MVDSGAGEAGLRTELQPVVDDLGLVLHIDTIEAGLHQRPVPDVCILVHGADRTGIVSQVTSAAAAAGLNIVDLESDVAGTDDNPIYVLQIQGVAAQGIAAIETALAPLQAEGVKVDVRPVDTLIG
jgi:glycine cleavage system transcriptional repressor